MHIQGNQLVPKLLLKLSGTLHKQYRYIEYAHDFLVLCTNNIGILSTLMKKCHAKKKNFWLNDCISNLSILFGLCILEFSFLY